MIISIRFLTDTFLKCEYIPYLNSSSSCRKRRCLIAAVSTMVIVKHLEKNDHSFHFRF